ncbi:hypothetical protein [Agrobacterium vitis]|uniref:hypothetical protein n=1 Tax=Agrobacterium vitis TaxID=373 RepID=UPI003D2C3E8B
MIGMQQIHLGQRGMRTVPLDQLAGSHGVTPNSARIYTRFFGQTAVCLSAHSHSEMLLDALSGLIADNPALRSIEGYGIYTKTQTHNTFFEQDWLREIFSTVGLGHWEMLTFSMTNCASGLAAVHLGASLGRPFVVLSGEKAFHETGSRLSVGLLGEAAVSVLFLPGGKYRLRSTHVSHLPRYHINPDDMAEADRKALQGEFEAGLAAFLQQIVEEDPLFFRQQPVIVPYNLNTPLIARVLRAVELDRNIAAGMDTAVGHMFCSDNYITIARNMLPGNRPAFLFSAGHGVTFSAMKLQANQSINEAGDRP